MHRLFALLLILLPLQTLADTARHAAGAFDYYVLALSWSPNWCALTGDARKSDQCDDRHDHGWILHGLWPQFESGYPQFCQTAKRAPSRAMTRDMSDIMGTAGLAWHQWKKHGTCSGLDAPNYYNLSRAAYAAVERPELLRELDRTVRIAPDVIQQVFLDANPGLKTNQITITCNLDHIQEARICLTKDLVFRTCGRDVLNDCSVPALFAPIR